MTIQLKGTRKLRLGLSSIILISLFIFYKCFGYWTSNDDSIQGWRLSKNKDSLETHIYLGDKGHFINYTMPDTLNLRDELYMEQRSFYIPDKLVNFEFSVNHGYHFTQSHNLLCDVNLSKQEIFRRLKHVFKKFAEWADTNSVPYWIADDLVLGWYWYFEILPWTMSIYLHVPANILPYLDTFRNNLIDERV
jgi:hypothetical protein